MITSINEFKKKESDLSPVNENRSLSSKEVLDYYTAHHMSTPEKLAEILTDIFNGRIDVYEQKIEMTDWLDN